MSYSRLNGKWGQVTSSCTAQCPDGQNTQAFRYVYDRFGNRWQQNVTAGAGPSPQFSFDANNRIAAGVAYDAAGELTSDGTHTYQYDGAGRLTGVDGGATASYVYDAEGRRVERAVGGQKFEEIYDLGGHMVAEMAAANGAWQRGEVFGAGRHIASYADGTTYFPHADWLGTERVRATAGDNPYEACASLWFGDGLACRFAASSLDPSPLHFTGKERDAESGNDYFGARYYASTTGRFLSPDWSAKVEPVPYAKLDDPQSLNLYSYVLNNPMTGRDPDGHVCIFGIGNTCTTVQAPPPPSPPPAPPIAMLHTSIKGGYTTFQWTDKKGGYHEDKVHSLVKVDSKPKPGAAGPIDSTVVGQIKGLKSPAYGPKGAQINIGDSRGRWIHGGGSSLANPYAPNQRLTPTFGCTRACNVDVQRLGSEITNFQTTNPNTPIPYSRTDQ